MLLTALFGACADEDIATPSAATAKATTEATAAVEETPGAPAVSPGVVTYLGEPIGNAGAEALPIEVDSAGALFMDWNDDGTLLAYVSGGDIWLYDGEESRNLTNTPDILEGMPAWSPDGSTIAFARGADCFYYYYECGWDVFVMDADGSNERRLSTGTGSRRQATDPSWSANGRTIAFTQAFCGFYYCDAPSVWIIDLHVNRVAEVTQGANPAWKP
jgi:Tol biopolymer transport system component